ncbi:YoaK family protein [Streptomyces sp. NPDC047971]|uniref:YoaK family protein n=1 Tax=Streptomyces sp. NPDC047971 TaxID=3154499 RepID=UPI0033D2E7DD
MEPRAGGAFTSIMVVLTLTTGVIEAVCFLALGPAFTAMQTGNLLLLAFALTGAAGLSPVAAGVSCAGFVVGAVLGSLLESSVNTHGRPWFAPALLGEGLLLGLGALVAWQGDVDGPGGPVAGHHFAAVALVAAAMGMRNVTTLRVRVPHVSTTLSTRALTAFVGGLPHLTAPRTGEGARHEGRRFASIGAMFAGGVLGAWLLHEEVSPAAVLALPAAVVLALGAASWADQRRHPSEAG